VFVKERLIPASWVRNKRVNAMSQFARYDDRDNNLVSSWVTAIESIYIIIAACTEHVVMAQAPKVVKTTRQSFRRRFGGVFLALPLEQKWLS